ncbi:hypothetical protein DFH09DRAFT_1069311 [Mycena vulgaris]|nr:hypothetical protein DFH09DRAFT_1069311 [Mycena vulgaris]
MCQQAAITGGHAQTRAAATVMAQEINQLEEPDQEDPPDAASCIMHISKLTLYDASRHISNHNCVMYSSTTIRWTDKHRRKIDRSSQACSLGQQQAQLQWPNSPPARALFLGDPGSNEACVLPIFPVSNFGGPVQYNQIFWAVCNLGPPGPIKLFQPVRDICSSPYRDRRPLKVLTKSPKPALTSQNLPAHAQHLVNFKPIHIGIDAFPYTVLKLEPSEVPIPSVPPFKGRRSHGTLQLDEKHCAAGSHMRSDAVEEDNAMVLKDRGLAAIVDNMLRARGNATDKKHKVVNATSKPGLLTSTSTSTTATNPMRG